MKVEIFVSLSIIAASFVQICTSVGPTDPSSAVVNGQTTETNKPPPLLEPLKDNVYYYVTSVGNFLLSRLIGDEYSLKYLIHKLLEGTEVVTDYYTKGSMYLRNTPLLRINSVAPNTKEEEIKQPTESTGAS